VFDRAFWSGKKVLVTGHTGFKGSWLCLWLVSIGAEVTGYALRPPTEPSLYELGGIGSMIHSVFGDVRDRKTLSLTVAQSDPDVIIHMAAQPLVRASYAEPAATYETNVMGTVHLLDAVRKAAHANKARAVINVTSDKCYDNKEWIYGYRETDVLGGHDPYSNSKACSELVTASFRKSFFPAEQYGRHGVSLATARAGNVIGGGDWAEDRLLPDCFRALLQGEVIRIRNPQAVRPWQHVLEPLSGYLTLAQRLYEAGTDYAESWNFGPDERDTRTVQWVVGELCARWGENAHYEADTSDHPHEAHILTLDCSKASRRLGWKPRWGLEHALDRTIEWIKAYRDGASMHDVCLRQLHEYVSTGE
jgi:CDP-glucose 4,6-dehydratase